MERLKPPVLFPCADRVQVPQVGADETKLHPQKTVSLQRGLLRPAKYISQVNREYVRKISADLRFDEAVVRDRCFHMLPYSDKYFLEAIDGSSLVPTPPRRKLLVGRNNTRGPDVRHMPCHIKNRGVHKLKPIKRKILESCKEKRKEEKDDKKDVESEVPPTESVFLTETLPFKPKQPEHQWDAYLMSELSQTTAQWIVTQKTEPQSQREKLREFLEERYGVLDNRSELICDDVSDKSDSEHRQILSRKWKKGNESLLERVRELSMNQELQSDPYGPETAAAFYRLPAGIRRAKKRQEKEEAGAINSTAHNIVVTSYRAPPPPTLRDYMNTAVGEKMFETDNRFEQEMLTGKTQTYQTSEDSDMILVQDNKYRKVLQSESPQKPEVWYPLTDKEKDKQKDQNKTLKNYGRGNRRWQSLPVPADETEENLSVMPPIDHPSIQNVVTEKKTNPASNLLVQIVEDWRAKWHLDMRYADASPDDLIRDMADIQPDIKLKAITTCARAAEYRPPPEPGIQLDQNNVKEKHVKLLPENLFIALECSLDDQHDNVRRAAAIALYSLERPTDKAEEILRTTLRDEASVDRWTAAQCLAYYGECDSEVVGELIWHLLHTEDTIRHDQAAHLLVKLSENSTLVHSMLAEQLNSSSWRHRYMACRLLPALEGLINKDLVHKLTHLMWNDWHGEIRKAAAQTLGKTGHGKHVHDELRTRIMEGDERQRLEAVSKIGYLGIMTARLLPTFLQCFHDSYVSVRMEVCVACSNLKIKDDHVMEKLVYVATYDPIWKVKALALQAFGKIGVVTKAIQDCILWAFRYEEEEGVRAEACHSVCVLSLKDTEVAQILQGRYLVETSQIVKQEIILALEMLGISPSEDIDMVARIKGEVRKLCSKNLISTQITRNEKEADHQSCLKRMIYLPPEAVKVSFHKRGPKKVSHQAILLSEQAMERPTSGLSDQSTSKHTLFRSETGSPRPTTAHSRDTMYTPVVDKEIANIMSKQGTMSPSTATSLVESRPETGYSGKTGKTEDTSCSDLNKSGSVALSHQTAKSRLDQVTENQTESRDAENEALQSENETVSNARKVILVDKQTGTDSLGDIKQAEKNPQNLITPTKTHLNDDTENQHQNSTES